MAASIAVATAALVRRRVRQETSTFPAERGRLGRQAGGASGNACGKLSRALSSVTTCASRKFSSQ